MVPTGTVISSVAPSRPLRPFGSARRAGLRAVLAAHALLEQRGEIAVRDQHDVAAAPAVAAVGAAARHELLAVQVDAAVAAVSGEDGDRHLVDEHLAGFQSGSIGQSRIRRAQRGRAAVQERGLGLHARDDTSA